MTDENAAIELARDLYGAAHTVIIDGNDFEIDPEPEVIETEDGFWVQAWVWVPKEEDA